MDVFSCTPFHYASLSQIPSECPPPQKCLTKSEPRQSIDYKISLWLLYGYFKFRTAVKQNTVFAVVGF